MTVKTVIRVVIGVMFILGGAIKTKTFGEPLAPGPFNAFRVVVTKTAELFPFEVTAHQLQEVVGYAEMMSGLLLLSGILIGPASSVLIVIMLGATYVLYKLDHPSWLVKASPMVLCYLILTQLFIPSLGRRGVKERQD